MRRPELIELLADVGEWLLAIVWALLGVAVCVGVAWCVGTLWLEIVR